MLLNLISPFSMGPLEKFLNDICGLLLWFTPYFYGDSLAPVP
jgi:hypothetical protein